MKKDHILTKFTILFVLTLVLTPSINSIAYSQELKLEGIEWLLGIWHFDEETSPMYEMWKRTSDKTFEGVAYNLEQKGMEEREVEALRILEVGESIYYLAKLPQNEFPTIFRATKILKKKVIFENPFHDFPRKITYMKIDPDKMRAILEGFDSKTGQPKTLELNYRRVG